MRKLFLAALLACGTAWGQADWPSRPIRMVVPFPPGGPTDIVARPVAQKLSESLGHQVVIDNRGGAGGTVGADLVAKAPADGYTVLMGTVGTQAINASLYAKLPYDPAQDFAAVTLVAAAPVALVAHPSVPVTSVAELLALARQKPGVLTFGSAGNGTPGHLSGEIFKSLSGAQIVHVPYKGSAPAITDLLGGQINLMFDPVQSVLPHIRSGKIRALGVSSARRSAILPAVPTLAEAGVSGYETTAWWGVAAPAKTPREIVVRLDQAIQKALADADFRARLQEIGIETVGLGPDAFAKFQRAEIEKWGAAVKAAGAKVD